MMIVDGVSLRQSLTNDRMAAAAGEFKGPFGMRYYAEKRRKYTRETSPQKMLKVNDGAQPIDKALEKAVASVLSHVPQFEPLSEHLDGVTAMNQRS